MKTFLFILLYVAANGQAPNLSNWKKDSIPNDITVFDANHTQDDWTFSFLNGKVEIERNKYSKIHGDSLPNNPEFIKVKKTLYGQLQVQKVTNGYILGFDKGENGGGLIFMDEAGNKTSILTETYEYGLNIKKIFLYNSKLLALEGLAHLGGNRGKIIEIFQDKGIWKYKKIVDLIETPKLLFTYKADQYIITSSQILSLDKNLKVTSILKAPFYWGMLYPSNVTVDGDDIYLAMRKGILNIKQFKNNPTYLWYTPK
ncbi:hypothetical protein HUK80_17875 [Flavobacterium sp. MAH-1]|uniref:WG containing repeat-containing protein n=2 Tax=Flavobacterium agri TaxID=2743471 RepID=A0A7Y9C745_9FLAO|nr:hypothetical protein [Flavobacterium agri]NYA72795.1 hypothetical protein [Flavobacterium agri]